MRSSSGFGSKPNLEALTAYFERFMAVAGIETAQSAIELIVFISPDIALASGPPLAQRGG
jgi:hypothetical protein